MSENEMQNKYKIVQLAADLFSVEENGVRCFLLIGTEAALLIDTGLGTGDLKAVVKELTDLPVIVANTHADKDHTGNNHQFERIYLHPAEFNRYRKANGYEQVLVPMWESDFIDIGGGCLEVILVPGHTPGSVALLDSKNRILFAGDTVSSAQIFMFGDGRDMEAYIYSLEKLSCRNDFDTVYCSHGEISVSAENVELLSKGARKVLEGGIIGTEPPFQAQCKVYDIGVAKLLY